LGFMGAVAVCRTAIKEALQKLITQVAEQGFKGVLKDLAKAAGESLVKNAIKRGTEFAMFTIKTKLGITALEAAEGHHPTFDPVEFAGEVADSFLTGALSAPFMFGKHGSVTEATSMAAGQFLDNMSKLPRNAIFNSMGLGQWAKDHGLYVSSDFSRTGGMGTSTLFGAVMGRKGMRAGARDAVADFKV